MWICFYVTTLITFVDFFLLWKEKVPFELQLIGIFFLMEGLTLQLVSKI